MNIQGWLPLGWTGWISWQSKGLSRVFWTNIESPGQQIPKDYRRIIALKIVVLETGNQFTSIMIYEQLFEEEKTRQCRIAFCNMSKYTFSLLTMQRLIFTVKIFHSISRCMNYWWNHFNSSLVKIRVWFSFSGHKVLVLDKSISR